MNVFLRLLLGHMIGDFVFQTGRIAEMKRVGLKGLLLHIGLVMLATSVPMITFPGWIRVVLVLGVVHLAIDAVRTYPLRQLERWGLPYFFVDQSVHVVVMALITIWAQPGYYSSPRDLLRAYSAVDHLALALSAFIFLVFTVPVIEALVGANSQEESSRIPKVTMRMRLLGAIERTLGLMVMQTPWPLVTPLLFVPHFLYRLQKHSGEPLSRKLVRPILSLLATLLMGLLLRYAL